MIRTCLSRALLCALAVAAAAPARAADTRSEAKRHFRSGMALIARGQLESGIAELQQAYAIKPHRDLLYNIARAYLDLGRISEALEYFRKYVATNPPDRVKEFSFKGSGGSYAKLFDGTEKVLSWDNILWINRSVSVP